MQLPAIRNRPLYVQAMDAVRNFVQAGDYQPGDMLPGEDVLAARLNVSRTTLREAMSYLERDGLIVRKHGIGTFVGRPHPRFTSGLHQLIPFRVLAGEAGLQVRMLSLEARMEAEDPFPGETPFSHEDPLLRVKASVGIVETPMAYFDAVIPTRLIDHDAFAAAGTTLLEYMLQCGQPVLSHMQSYLHAIAADRTLAERMRIPEGAPVLRMVETCISTAAQPVFLSHNYYATERYNFMLIRQIEQVRFTQEAQPAGPVETAGGA